MPTPDRNRRIAAFVVAMAVLVVTPLAGIAADAFTDVPDTNVFHEDIAWLADAGVTQGCNPPVNTEFCPSDNVTREQMAAFMRRLALYIGAEDGTPEDADNLGGLPPSAYQSVIGAAAESGGLGSVGEAEPFRASYVTVEAPTDGVLIISGSTAWELGDTWFKQWLEVDVSGVCDSWSSKDRIPGSGAEASAMGKGTSLSSQGIIEVTAGTHTVYLCLWPVSSSSPSLNVSHSLIVEHQRASDVSIVEGRYGP
jgi:hypothetical protein